MRRHIAGAVHLTFSELTKADFARGIPSKNTRILIYGNNNFVETLQFLANKLPTLAFNIPTFVTLYGYGYSTAGVTGFATGFS